MAYITLDELKEILPDIFNTWIGSDEGDWEWIFQEIEQKCHIGKKEKKKKKFDSEEWIKRNRVDIDALINKFQQMDKDLKQAINNNTQLGLSMKDMGAEIRRIREDVKSAKSMAQTAKQRTEVDYTKCSKEKDVDAVREIYDRLAGRGATVEELENFRNLIEKYDVWEKKEIPVVKKIGMCTTCKYFNNKLKPYKYPCNECDYNSKWEDKDNG